VKMEAPRLHGITAQITSLYAHCSDSLRIWSAGCKPRSVMSTISNFNALFQATAT
jgi:hypothetical protein